VVDVWIDKRVEVPKTQMIVEYVDTPIVKKVDYVIEKPGKTKVVERIVEVPEIRVEIKTIEVIKTEEEVVTKRVEVETVEEEIVEMEKVYWVDKVIDKPKVRKLKRYVDVPTIKYIDKVLEVPKIVVVEKEEEIWAEVHHDVFEETHEEVELKTEQREDVTKQKVEVNGGDIEPLIGETVHEWNLDEIPPQYRSIRLPKFEAAGLRKEH
jgi:hypothetical protein